MPIRQTQVAASPVVTTPTLAPVEASLPLDEELFEEEDEEEPVWTTTIPMDVPYWLLDCCATTGFEDTTVGATITIRGLLDEDT